MHQVNSKLPWFLLLTSAAMMDPHLEMTSVPQNLSTLYPEQTAVVTCITRGSGILAWSSENYIGQSGVQLEFLSSDEPGKTLQQLNNNTVAILVNVTNENGNRILVSKLYIIGSPHPTYPNSSVTCSNVGFDMKAVITFNVVDTPAIKLNSSLLEVCHGDRIKVVCETLGSPTLAWSSDGYIGVGAQLEFRLIDSPGTTLSSAINPLANTTAKLDSVSMQGRRIVSTLSLIVSSNVVTVTCNNVGIDIKKKITLQLTDTCTSSDSTTTVPVLPTTEGSRDIVDGSESVPYLTGIIVVVIFITAMIISVCIVCSIIFIALRRKRAVNLDNLIHELPQIKHIWKQFGKRVGIKQEVLDECAKTKSPEVAMLEYWLKATKPTWKDVTTTLRVINHPQLAQGIETRHKIDRPISSTSPRPTSPPATTQARKSRQVEQELQERNGDAHQQQTKAQAESN